MGDWPTNNRAPQQQVIAPTQPGALMGEMMLVGAGASTAWGTANMALYIPVSAVKRFICGRFWWTNGGVVSGNVDVGVFDQGGNKLDSCGAVAQAGTTTIQHAAVLTGGALYGAYYIGIMCTSATATLIAGTVPHTAFARACGIKQQTGLGAALPTTATFSASTQTFIPHFGISATNYR